MLTIYYSPENEGFYRSDLHSDLPADAIEITTEKHRELLEAPMRKKRIVLDDTGQPVLADPPPLSIAEVAARQRTAIATALADALAAGMPHTMPDGTEDTVQMLAEDRQNLLGLAIEARDLKAAGVTDPVQEFRGLSNTRYPMTPDETIALTDAALAHYKAFLQRSWDRKDAIDSALAAEDREGIEAVVW